MANRVRIAYDARYINDRYHGIGRVAFELLEAMVSMNSDYTFVVFRSSLKESRFDWSTVEGRPNVEIKMGPGPLYWPHEHVLWPFILRKNRIAVFHSPYFMVPILKSPCSISTVYDLCLEQYPWIMRRRWELPIYKTLMKICTKKAYRIIVPTAATRDDLSSYYNVPLDIIEVIPEGVSPGFGVLNERGHLDSIRRRYDLDGPFILSVGARRPHKNLGRLVRAFARILNDVDHNLVFVGPEDPRCTDEAKECAVELKITDRVRFLGWVPEPELPAFYNLADLVVIPSLIEGFGLPVLEAMACGTPLVGSTCGAVSQVVGDAGILVDPYDVDCMAIAIGKILKDRELHSETVRKGFERASGFTWEKAAQATMKLYESALSNAGGM